VTDDPLLTLDRGVLVAATGAIGGTLAKAALGALGAAGFGRVYNQWTGEPSCFYGIIPKRTWWGYIDCGPTAPIARR